ncbi:MAG: hypothetical protein AB2L20_30510 [Mangrovibacterium sp.]
MNRIINFVLIFVVIEACKNSPIKISEIEGHDFVLCNIAKIKDTRSLKLSEIAEYSQIVALSNDSTLVYEDYNIQRTFVSDKYIVVLPWSRPALLYTRNGKFIKRLIPSNKPNDKNLCAIYAQIDDEKDMIYLLVCGLKLLKYSVYDFNVVNIPKAFKEPMDFVLFNTDKMFVIYSNEQNIWGYIQSIHSPRAEYIINSRSTNNLFNYVSGSGKILKWGDMPVLSFLYANDTSYYYNLKSNTFSPFLYCYSTKNIIDFNAQIENSPKSRSIAEKEILTGNILEKKRLLYVSDRYIIFELYCDIERYFIIDKDSRQAYYFNAITNDFWGTLDMNFRAMFNGWHYVNNKDGYFTFVFSKNQLQEEIKRQDIHKLNKITQNKLNTISDKIENAKYSHNILFVNKLKK